MTGMRMAKADEKDCDAAYELMSILDNLDRGYYPARESDEDAPTFFEADDRDHLQFLHKRLEELMERAPGFIGRIVVGYCAVILNPENKIVDPDDDCLSLHPELAGLQDQNAELRSQVDLVTGALYRLEAACDQRAAVLSIDAYNAAMECRGMGDALQYLDQCRTEARKALATVRKPADSAVLYAIHVPGPEEIYAMPSKEVAEICAAKHNATIGKYLDTLPLKELSPSRESCMANVVEWDGTAEGHAEALTEFDAAEWGIGSPAGEGGE